MGSINFCWQITNKKNSRVAKSRVRGDHSIIYQSNYQERFRPKIIVRRVKVWRYSIVLKSKQIFWKLFIIFYYCCNIMDTLLLSVTQDTTHHLSFKEGLIIWSSKIWHNNFIVWGYCWSSSTTYESHSAQYLLLCLFTKRFNENGNSSEKLTQISNPRSKSSSFNYLCKSRKAVDGNVYSYCGCWCSNLTCPKTVALIASLVTSPCRKMLLLHHTQCYVQFWNQNPKNDK